MNPTIKNNLAIVLFLCLAQLDSYSQFTYFNNRYNNDYLSSGRAIIETDSGYIISGESGVIYNEYYLLRIVMTKIDFKGNQLWWKSYGEDFHNYYTGDVRCMDRTFDGGYVVGGSIDDSIRSVGSLMKFDQNGDSLWTKIFGDTVSPYFTGTMIRVAQELPNHGFILAGSKYVSEDDGDIILIKTDSMGNPIWSHIYGLIHIIEDCGSIAQLPDGGFILGIGKSNNNMLYSADGGILKVDSLGNQIWIKYYGGYKDDYGCAVTLSQTGNYLFSTAYAVEEPGPQEPRQKVSIVKTDTSGNIIWEKKYGYPLFIGSSCTIDELPNGEIVVSGQGSFLDSYNMQGWIIKVKPDGDSIWMRRYDYYHVNNGNFNYLNDIAITSDNGIILTGEIFSPPNWEQSIWVQKLDSIGCDSAGCDPTVGISHDPPVL